MERDRRLLPPLLRPLYWRRVSMVSDMGFHRRLGEAAKSRLRRYQSHILLTVAVSSLGFHKSQVGCYSSRCVFKFGRTESCFRPHSSSCCLILHRNGLGGMQPFGEARLSRSWPYTVDMGLCASGQSGYGSGSALRQVFRSFLPHQSGSAVTGRLTRLVSAIAGGSICQHHNCGRLRISTITA